MHLDKSKIDEMNLRIERKKLELLKNKRKITNAPIIGISDWTKKGVEYYSNMHEGKMEFTRYGWAHSKIPNTPMDILEIGFASGDALSVLADKGHRCVGADLPLNVEQVKTFRTFRENIRYDVVNIDKPDCFAWNEPYIEQFDYVICLYVLQHVIFDTSALFGMFYCLRPGGILLISVPNQTSGKRHIAHYYEPITLERMLQGIGFEIIEGTAIDGELWVMLRRPEQ